MRLEGKTAIAAPREKVWSFLTDPASVASCAPGLESLEVVVPGERFRVMAAVGFGSVKARFSTDVVWLDLEKPNRASMKAHGTAPVGAADATAEMTLEDGPDGSTELTWTAQVTVAGTIAGLASRLLGGISTRVTAAFFACVRERIEGGAKKLGRLRRRRGKV
jgi:uncharacterized protein